MHSIHCARVSTIRRIGASLLFAIATFAISGTAQAEEEFDVTVSGNTVTVTTKGAWHINKEYSWKLVAGGTKLDKSKFTIAEKSASVSGAPKGDAKLKGAVCSGDSCKPFEKDIKIP